MDQQMIVGLCILVPIGIFVAYVAMKPKPAPSAAAAAETVVRPPSPPGPITSREVFWAVFWAMWAFSLSAALLLAVFRFVAMIAS